MSSSVLVISTNWVGDCIMSMPAVEAYHRSHPDVSIHVLCRPHLRDLWELLPAVSQIHTAGSGNRELLGLRSRFRKFSFSKIYVFPNSVRSGLMAWWIGASERIGFPGHHRSCLLTKTVLPESDAEHQHQCWEAFQILGVAYEGDDHSLPCPDLIVAEEEAAELIPAESGKWVGFIPCAARGPSKEWPEEYFLELGRDILTDTTTGILLFGGPGDQEKCERMAEQLGVRAVSLAGRTSMKSWAACLRACELVVANDSGGMHLAAALQIPVVAIFGQTDPARTGPLGASARIIKESKVANRAITRDSQSAQESLRAISVERVADEIQAVRSAEHQEKTDG